MTIHEEFQENVKLVVENLENLIEIIQRQFIYEDLGITQKNDITVRGHRQKGLKENAVSDVFYNRFMAELLYGNKFNEILMYLTRYMPEFKGEIEEQYYDIGKQVNALTSRWLTFDPPGQCQSRIRRSKRTEKEQSAVLWDLDAGIRGLADDLRYCAKMAREAEQKKGGQADGGNKNDTEKPRFEDVINAHLPLPADLRPPDELRQQFAPIQLLVVELPFRAYGAARRIHGGNATKLQKNRTLMAFNMALGEILDKVSRFAVSMRVYTPQQRQQLYQGYESWGDELRERLKESLFGPGDGLTKYTAVELEVKALELLAKTFTMSEIDRQTLDQAVKAELEKAKALPQELTKASGIEGEWSKPMTKAKIMLALGIDSYKTLNTFSNSHPIEKAGSRKLWQIKLDGLNKEQIEKLKKV